MERTIKNYTEEQISEVESFLEEGVIMDTNRICEFYLTLGQSDNSKDVRFVLYRFNLKCASAYVDPFRFCCILADDLMEAAIKARRIAGKNVVIVDFDSQRLKKEKSKPNYLPFGKYEGQSINDVMEVNPSYVLWLSNNYNGRNKGLIERLSEIRQEAAAKVTEINREKGSSYIGEVGQKVKVEGEVISIATTGNYYSDEVIHKIRVKDDNGNTVTRSGKLPDGIEKGARITIEGTVKNHSEYLGVKYTFLGGRCKITPA